MAYRNETTTFSLRTETRLLWNPKPRLKVPVMVKTIFAEPDHVDVEVELLRAGGGYTRGDRITVSATRLTNR